MKCASGQPHCNLKCGGNAACTSLKVEGTFQPVCTDTSICTKYIFDIANSSNTTFIPAKLTVKTPVPTNVSTIAPRGLTKADKKTVSTAGSTASALTVASPTSVASAGRLSLIRNLGCSVDDVDLQESENLDWEFHPSRLAINLSDDEHKYMIGALIMNPLLLVSILLLLLVISKMISTYNGITYSKVLGTWKTPGIVFIPYLFLLQGTSLVATRLVFDSPAAVAVLSSVVFLSCIGSPVLLYYYVLRNVQSKAIQIPDPRLHPDDLIVKELISEGEPIEPYKGWKALAYKFIVGDRIWVSRDSDSYFAEKFGVVFESYREGKTWFVLIDIGVMLTLSILSAWHPGNNATMCGSRNILICLLFLSFLIAIVFYKPFCAALDNLLSALLAGMMFIAVLFMTIGLLTSAEGGLLFTLAAWCLLISAILVAIKAVWDIVLYGIIIYVSRRATTRKVFRTKAAIISFVIEEPKEMEDVVNVDAHDPLSISLNESLLEDNKHEVLSNSFYKISSTNRLIPPVDPFATSFGSSSRRIIIHCRGVM